MKNSTIFSIALGMAAGAIVATFYKPIQNMIKKGTKTIKQSAENMINRAEERE